MKQLTVTPIIPCYQLLEADRMVKLFEGGDIFSLGKGTIFTSESYPRGILFTGGKCPGDKIHRGRSVPGTFEQF